MNNHKILTRAAAAVLLAIGSAGCAHQRAKTSAAGGKGGAGPSFPGGSATEASEAIVRGDVMHPIDELKTVTFDYNSDVLGKEARATLKSNASWLKKNPSVKVQVAGNCDQRGTEAYNLALGQRRAKAVRDYLKMAGISGKRVATISYGKEKPVCQEMTEDCWSRNRRAETWAAFPPPVASNK